MSLKVYTEKLTNYDCFASFEKMHVDYFPKLFS